MADFKDTLVVRRHIEPTTGNKWFCYDFFHYQEDLADGTVRDVDWGEEVSLGEACHKISDFAPSFTEAKKYIKIFLEKDKITITDEY